MILLLGEINCSKYFAKRVSGKCISIKECTRLHNLKCEVQFLSDIQIILTLFNRTF